MIGKLPYTILVFVLMFATNVMAQFDTTWVKTYGGNRDDKAFDIIKTTDNGFLIIGSTGSFGLDNSQMYFLKLDSTGAIMWSKSHGGPGQESGQSVIQTTDGGYLGIGYTNSWGSGGFDYLIVKLDINGNLEYEDYYGGSDWDFAWDVLEVSPEVFLIAGETQSYGAGSTDGWVVKFDGNTRQFVWDKTIGTTNYENFKAIAPGANGSFVTAGKGTQLNRTDEDVIVTKFDSLGDTIWTKYYGDTLQDYANDIIWMSDGTYALTGSSELHNDSSYSNTLKINEDGQLIWIEQWIIRVKNIGTKLIEIPPATLIIIGTEENINKETDIFIVRTIPYNQYRDELIIFGPFNNEIGTGVLPGKNGKVIACGYSNSYAPLFDILLFQTDSNLTDINPNIQTHQNDYNNVLSNNNIEPSIPFQVQTTTSKLIVSQPSNITFDLVLMSLNGSIITTSHRKSKHEIETLGLSTGLYFIQIRPSNGESTISRKVLISH